MIDHFDLVRAFYRSVNAGDIEALRRGFDAAVVAERVLFDGDAEPHAGRAAVVSAWREYLRRFAGGFPDGAHYRVRTIGGIQTGWGWVHAEWLQSAVDRDSGARSQFSGYSHFLVEDGLIRRHRSVREDAIGIDFSQPGSTSPASGPRTYPSRPIVGVGAVVRVDDAVVLIRRRHEPLAGEWSLPGGTLELGETLEAGVAREILEETGLVIRVGPVIDVFDRILLDEGGTVRYHFVLVDYLCRAVAGAPRSGSDASDVVLADPRDLARYRLVPKAVDVIARSLTIRWEDS